MITAPYFLATKFEAFHGRGNSDYRMSHDLEDIVTVIDGRPELASEVEKTDHAVAGFSGRRVFRSAGESRFPRGVAGISAS